MEYYVAYLKKNRSKLFQKRELTAFNSLVRWALKNNSELSQDFRMQVNGKYIKKTT